MAGSDDRRLTLLDAEGLVAILGGFVVLGGLVADVFPGLHIEAGVFFIALGLAVIVGPRLYRTLSTALE